MCVCLCVQVCVVCMCMCVGMRVCVKRKLPTHCAKRDDKTDQHRVRLVGLICIRVCMFVCVCVRVKRKLQTHRTKSLLLAHVDIITMSRQSDVIFSLVVTHM